MTEKPLIARTVADCRAAADAVKVAVGDVSELLALIGGLFGDSPPVGESEPVENAVGWSRERKRRHFIERVKRLAVREVREIGFTGPGDAHTLIPHWSLESIWPEAVAAGAEQVILDELSKVEGFTALLWEGAVGGVVITTVMDWLRAAGQWIVDHKDELLAIARVFLTFLMMIGLL